MIDRQEVTPQWYDGFLLKGTIIAQFDPDPNRVNRPMQPAMLITTKGGMRFYHHELASYLEFELPSRYVRYDRLGHGMLDIISMYLSGEQCVRVLSPVTQRLWQTAQSANIR